MKFLIAFVHNHDVEPAAEALRNHGFRFTLLDSTSGFLQEESHTFLLGVREEMMDECLAVFRNKCKSRRVGAPMSALAGQIIDEEKYKRYSETNKPITVEVGGAVGFVVDADKVL